MNKLIEFVQSKYINYCFLKKTTEEKQGKSIHQKRNDEHKAIVLVPSGNNSRTRSIRKIKAENAIPEVHSGNI